MTVWLVSLRSRRLRAFALLAFALALVVLGPCRPDTHTEADRLERVAVEAVVSQCGGDHDDRHTAHDDLVRAMRACVTDAPGALDPAPAVVTQHPGPETAVRPLATDHPCPSAGRALLVELCLARS